MGLFQELDSYPADLDILDRCEVVYKDFPGWQKSTTNAATYYDLPKEARAYIEVLVTAIFKDDLR